MPNEAGGSTLTYLELVIPGIEEMALALDPREAHPCWLCGGDGEVGQLVNVGDWIADLPPRFPCEACGGLGIELELGVSHAG